MTTQRSPRLRKVQRRSNRRIFWRYVPHIIRRLREHTSYDPEGSRRREIAVADFSSVKELEFLLDNKAYQGSLRLQIMKAFKDDKCSVNFMKGKHGSGIIITVKFH